MASAEGFQKLGISSRRELRGALQEALVTLVLLAHAVAAAWNPMMGS